LIETVFAVPAFPYVVAAFFGAMVGSFLNVCIHRLPRGGSILWPSSLCPSCRTPIRLHDNVPVVSFVALRGRCRACRAPISWRYPLVEAATALGFAMLVWRFGFTWAAASYALLLCALIVITGTDLSHRIIPDAVTLPGMVIGLAASATVLPVGFLNALLGLLVGGGLLWFAAWVSPYLFGKEGMGGGDIKLLGMVGAFLGWKPALLTILLGALVGSIVGIALIAARVIQRDDYVPFGPFLALGAVIALLFHQHLMAWYFTAVAPRF
jgi:leader peptidase (prepilin peptidase) / N-methyltransferase